MVLNRLGNKREISQKLIPFFPNHEIYIELFFGCGGMFFNKPIAKHNFLNDIDSDVYNLFRQLIDNKEELIKYIQLTPITERQFKEWGKGKREESEILNAIRFLFISNFGLYGQVSSLRMTASMPKEVILSEIEKTFQIIKNVFFFNCDFRKAFNKIDYKPNILKTFCYADPPYLNTANNYSHSFTEKDSFDLFELLQSTGIKWAMSEFDHPFIINQSIKRGLNIHYITERKNILNTRTEILITNYNNIQPTLFD